MFKWNILVTSFVLLMFNRLLRLFKFS